MDSNKLSIFNIKECYGDFAIDSNNLETGQPSHVARLIEKINNVVSESEGLNSLSLINCITDYNSYLTGFGNGSEIHTLHSVDTLYPILLGNFNEDEQARSQVLSLSETICTVVPQGGSETYTNNQERYGRVALAGAVLGKMASIIQAPSSATSPVADVTIKGLIGPLFEHLSVITEELESRCQNLTSSVTLSSPINSITSTSRHPSEIRGLLMNDAPLHKVLCVLAAVNYAVMGAGIRPVCPSSAVPSSKPAPESARHGAIKGKDTYLYGYLQTLVGRVLGVAADLANIVLRETSTFAPVSDFIGATRASDGDNEETNSNISSPTHPVLSSLAKATELAGYAQEILSSAPMPMHLAGFSALWMNELHDLIAHALFLWILTPFIATTWHEVVVDPRSSDSVSSDSVVANNVASVSSISIASSTSPPYLLSSFYACGHSAARLLTQLVSLRRLQSDLFSNSDPLVIPISETVPADQFHFNPWTLSLTNCVIDSIEARCTGGSQDHAVHPNVPYTAFFPSLLSSKAEDAVLTALYLALARIEVDEAGDALATHRALLSGCLDSFAPSFARGEGGGGDSTAEEGRGTGVLADSSSLPLGVESIGSNGFNGSNNALSVENEALMLQSESDLLLRFRSDLTLDIFDACENRAEWLRWRRESGGMGATRGRGENDNEENEQNSEDPSTSTVAHVSYEPFRWSWREQRIQLAGQNPDDLLEVDAANEEGDEERREREEQTESLKTILDQIKEVEIHQKVVKDFYKAFSTYQMQVLDLKQRAAAKRAAVQELDQQWRLAETVAEMEQERENERRGAAAAAAAFLSSGANSASQASQLKVKLQEAKVEFEAILRDLSRVQVVVVKKRPNVRSYVDAAAFAIIPALASFLAVNSHRLASTPPRLEEEGRVTTCLSQQYGSMLRDLISETILDVLPRFQMDLEISIRTQRGGVPQADPLARGQSDGSPYTAKMDDDNGDDDNDGDNDAEVDEGIAASNGAIDVEAINADLLDRPQFRNDFCAGNAVLSLLEALQGLPGGGGEGNRVNRVNRVNEEEEEEEEEGNGSGFTDKGKGVKNACLKTLGVTWAALTGTLPPCALPEGGTAAAAATAAVMTKPTAVAAEAAIHLLARTGGMQLLRGFLMSRLCTAVLAESIAVLSHDVCKVFSSHRRRPPLSPSHLSEVSSNSDNENDAQAKDKDKDNDEHLQFLAHLMRHSRDVVAVAAADLPRVVNRLSTSCMTEDSETRDLCNRYFARNDTYSTTTTTANNNSNNNNNNNRNIRNSSTLSDAVVPYSILRARVSGLSPVMRVGHVMAALAVLSRVEKAVFCKVFPAVSVTTLSSASSAATATPDPAPPLSLSQVTQWWIRRCESLPLSPSSSPACSSLSSSNNDSSDNNDNSNSTCTTTTTNNNNNNNNIPLANTLLDLYLLSCFLNPTADPPPMGLSAPRKVNPVPSGPSFKIQEAAAYAAARLCQLACLDDSSSSTSSSSSSSSSSSKSFAALVQQALRMDPAEGAEENRISPKYDAIVFSAVVGGAVQGDFETAWGLYQDLSTAKLHVSKSESQLLPYTWSERKGVVPNAALNGVLYGAVFSSYDEAQQELALAAGQGMGVEAEVGQPLTAASAGDAAVVVAVGGERTPSSLPAATVLTWVRRVYGGAAGVAESARSDSGGDGEGGNEGRGARGRGGRGRGGRGRGRGRGGQNSLTEAQELQRNKEIEVYGFSKLDPVRSSFLGHIDLAVALSRGLARVALWVEEEGTLGVSDDKEDEVAGNSEGSGDGKDSGSLSSPPSPPSPPSPIVLAPQHPLGALLGLVREETRRWIRGGRSVITNSSSNYEQSPWIEYLSKRLAATVAPAAAARRGASGVLPLSWAVLPWVSSEGGEGEKEGEKGEEERLIEDEEQIRTTRGRDGVDWMEDLVDDQMFYTLIHAFMTHFDAKDAVCLEEREENKEENGGQSPSITKQENESETPNQAASSKAQDDIDTEVFKRSRPQLSYEYNLNLKALAPNECPELAALEVALVGFQDADSIIVQIPKWVWNERVDRARKIMNNMEPSELWKQLEEAIRGEEEYRVDGHRVTLGDGEGVEETDEEEVTED